MADDDWGAADDGGGGWDDAPKSKDKGKGKEKEKDKGKSKAKSNADDEWGDAGDGEAAGGDDWGDAGNDDGGWKEDDMGQGDQAEEMGVEVQIENAFYEAEDTRLEDPKKALEQFKKVVELSKSVERLEDETLNFVFKSMRYMVIIYLQQKKNKETSEAYKQLLAFVPKVTKNEGQEAVSAVLHEVDDNPDRTFVAQVYKETSETLKKMPDQERLWFRVNMRYCELTAERGDYKEAQALLGDLLKSCRHPDGSDDLNKGAELLEIYALELRMSSAAQDNVKLKELFERTNKLVVTVKDPKTQSVIRECWGQMYGNQGDWSKAYTEFFKAFGFYQDLGQRDKAKQCLKYVVIANMLAGGMANPFDAREAKALQSDKDIEALETLRVSYERVNVPKFLSSLDHITKDGDLFTKRHLDNIVRDFHRKAIKELIKAYRRVRIDFLAQTLRITSAQVESLLIQLVLDSEIVGRIDQIKGLLDLTENVGGGSRYVAIERWANTVNHLRNNLSTPTFNVR